MIRIYILLCTLFFALSTTTAQSNEFVNNLRLYNLKEAETQISLLPKKAKALASWQIEFLKDFKISNENFSSLENITKPNDNGIGDYLYYINWGDYFFYNSLDKNIKAIDNYKQALIIAKKLDNKLLTGESLKRILTLHRVNYLYNNQTYVPFLEDYKQIVYDEYEEAYYHYFNLILNFKNYDVDQWSQNSYKKLSNYLKKNDHPYLRGISQTVFASYFEEVQKQDSIWYYANSAKQALDSIPYGYKGTRLNQINSFMSRISLQEEKFEKAEIFRKNATTTLFTSIDLKTKSLGHYQKSVIDSVRGDFLSAYDESMKYRVSMAEIEEAAQNNLFNELEVKYESAEKEKEIVLIENANQKQRYILIALGSLLILGSIIAFLIYRNTKRKQRIAEQQREIEIQKTEKILKEQEITSINAMIEGQEKERQRVASDLHDSVGATLAAAKLQFDHISKNKDKALEMDELFEKTKILLDDAYSEVRSMAHIKNSGVIAKNGLLPAIKKLTDNVSINGNLEVALQDFGLENRLDNSLEITIFRIIQELITNIVKHASATEASINITQHESLLSIIVEDNGKGFNISEFINSTNGMGLSSIERRVEHLEGTMEVDSFPGKGTSILIDIPL
ncbi:sensor histidine kinase [Patiriisocius marinus]|uniref:Oxygen sensor histidine kinase NreB n=1 Tax=Patiriisocius marinus TaxID=1397112 RepID=A0A5J4J5L2_9FLAO|nr:sensor histidine kinase [Patiriisocius marinus]GER59757.1 hypothetical protein ULMA_18650 [Patiriisocius marinus]